MWQNVSNTAEFGGRTRGKRIITKQTKDTMKEILREIQEDRFADEWVTENKTGQQNLGRLRDEGKKHQIEAIGVRLRKMMQKGEN
jgi:ketol-acid reductoisomerase